MATPDRAMRLAIEWAEVVNLLALVSFTKRGRDPGVWRDLEDHLTVLLELSAERPSLLDQMSRPEFRAAAESLRETLATKEPRASGSKITAAAKVCFQAAGFPEFPGGWKQFFEFSERTLDRPELQKLVGLLVQIALPELRARGDVRDPRPDLAGVLRTLSSDGSALDSALARLRSDLDRVGEAGPLDELAPAARLCLDALEYRLDSDR